MNLPADWSFALLESIERAIQDCGVCDRIRIADTGYTPTPCLPESNCGCEIVLTVTEGWNKRIAIGDCTIAQEAEISVYYRTCRVQHPDTGPEAGTLIAERSAARENSRTRIGIAGAIVAGLSTGKITACKFCPTGDCKSWGVSPWVEVEEQGNCSVWRMVVSVQIAS